MKHSDTPWRVSRTKYNQPCVVDNTGEEIAFFEHVNDAETVVLLANGLKPAKIRSQIPWKTNKEDAGCRSIFDANGIDIGYVAGFPFEVGEDGDALFIVELVKSLR